MLLAAKRVHDWALEGVRKLHQFGVGAGASPSAEQGDPRRAVEHGRQGLQLLGRGNDLCGRYRQAARGRRRTLRRLAQRNVARNDNDRNPAQADGRANGILQHIGQLARVGHELAIVAAFLKEILRVRLLKIAAADLDRGNLGGDRQHRNPASVSVEQPVDQMQIARPAGAGADGELAGDLRLAGRGECSHLLMSHVDPFDLASAAERLIEAIEAVADDPEDAFDAGLLQRRHDEIGYVVDGH